MAMERELLKSARQKPCTLIYPFEKLPPTKGLRGKHIYDAGKCIGCGLCARVCPAFAIVLIGGQGPKCEGLKVYLGRCLFCQQCEEVCPTGAIKLTQEYEMAVLSQDGCVLVFERKPAEKPQEKPPEKPTEKHMEKHTEKKE